MQWTYFTAPWLLQYIIWHSWVWAGPPLQRIVRFCNQKNVNVNAISQAWRYRKNVTDFAVLHNVTTWTQDDTTSPWQVKTLVARGPKLPLLRVQLQHRLGWSFCYLLKVIHFCSLHRRILVRFLFRQVLAPGQRFPESLGMKIWTRKLRLCYWLLPARTATFYLLDPWTSWICWIFFLRTDWCPGLLRASLRLNPKNVHVGFVEARPSSAQDRKTKDVKIWKSRHPEDPPVW